MDNDEIENISTNTSGNRPFEDIMEHRISRRGAIGGGVMGAAAFFAGSAFSSGSVSANGAAGDNLGFTAIAPSTADGIALPDGYSHQVFAKWGDPINGKSPRFRPDASNPAEHQERQLGHGHDGMHFFPLGRDRDSNKRGLLCINHEFSVGIVSWPDGFDNWDAVKTRKDQASHGISVIEVVQKGNGQWQVVPSFRARRITANTEMLITGPASGHRLLRTPDFPGGKRTYGMLNQCASGKTPWGTYLTSEENFNGYFWEETEGTAPGITEEQAGINARYGVARRGFGYRWATTDDRFRADLQPHSPNTFGFMVEVDPYAPGKPAAKRTALGRSKHEGAAFLTAPGGEVVVYMGDDQRFDYIYKFVSAYPWASEVAAGRSPLDDGTLYVARFSDDGTGEWLPLVQGYGPLTAENGFADQGDVLVKARMAADAMGATPMDRPEWTTSNPETGDVFVTLTNNTRRGAVSEEIDGVPHFEATPGRFVPSVADGPNPRLFNSFGHILKWNEGGDPTSTTFEWEIFLLAGDAASGTDAAGEDMLGSPDGLWLDDHGILWIQTDGAQPDGSNDQMLACDPATGDIKRFAVGPPGCEVTGVTATPDGKTLFFNIQHPGGSGFSGDPRENSNWPDGIPGGIPRAATVVVTKDDGGRVGT